MDIRIDDEAARFRFTHHSGTQFRGKVKKLKQHYKKINKDINNHSGSITISKWFDNVFGVICMDSSGTSQERSSRD